MKYFYFLFFYLISSTMFSQDKFTYLFDDVTGNKIWVFLENSEDSKWEFWVKTVVPAKKYKNKKGKLITSNSTFSLQFMEIDCNENLYSLLDYTFYDDKGKVVSSGNSYSINNRIVPDSVVDGIRDYVCQ